MKSVSFLLIAFVSSGASFAEVARKDGVLVDRDLAPSSKSGEKETSSGPNAAGVDILFLKETGDVLHGTFGGIRNKLIWERTDVERAIPFDLAGVRQIILGENGRLEMGKDTSFVNLVSGDRIPGRIVSLDDKELIMKSPVVGDLTIPRPLLKSINPNPFGGQLIYDGPHTNEGWVILEKEGAAPAPKEEQEAEDESKEKRPVKPSSWIHSGSAFYSQDNKPLVFPGADLPDIGRIRFRATWKGRINLNLALLCDFTRPVPSPSDENEDEDDGEDNALPELKQERLVDLLKGNSFQSAPWIKSGDTNLPVTYGSGYFLYLYNSYPNLVRMSFDNRGAPSITRLSRQRIAQSLAEQEEAEIEIRFNRKQGLILLYLNGEYAAQWNDLEGAPGSGQGFALLNSNSSSRVKIDDLVVTSWNGMKDSAQSMTHPERDMALLVNGSDRFSGNLTQISDGVAHLQTDYVEARIPVADLAQLVFKEGPDPGLDEEVPALPDWEKEPLTIIYQPYGIIKLIPTTAGPDSIKGTSPFLGTIEADLSAASLLRFTESSPDLSDWFEDF